MRRTRSLIPWLLLAVIALIAYGSLYPFNFKADAIEGGVFKALERLSWARAGRGDRIANVLLYLPFGFCLYLWLDTRLRRRVSLLVATALGALFSLGIEVAQVYVSARVPSLKDLALNTLGASLGAVGGLAWRGIGQLIHLPAREEDPSRDPGAALVIATWLIFRFAPFVPQFDLGKLKLALQPLFEPQWDAVSVFVYLACWLVVNHAAGAFVRRSRRLEALLLIIAAVLGGRLLVANQTFVADELFALLLLLPLLVVMHWLTPDARRRLLLVALATVLAIEGLAPFDFTGPTSSFDFWPFRIWLDAGATALHVIDWTALLGRLFLLTAFLWLVREAGAPINVSIAIVVGASLAIETLQLWLPDQDASITDPVMALGMGLLLRALERARARRAAPGVTFPPARNR
ncbi:MAG: VanZ family protein [Xanthomonadaceae bacterium]|nr:VanZ family protein [Xanthomonadaceae bacterium]